MPPKSPLTLSEATHHALDWPFNWPDFPKSARPPHGTRPNPPSLSAEDEEERIAFPENKDKMAEQQQRKTRAIPLHPSTARTVTDLTNTSPFHRSTPRPMVLGEGPIYRASDSTLHWFSCLPDPSTTPPTPPSLQILRVDPETGLAAPGEVARVVPLEESVTVAAFRAGKPGSYVCAYYAGIAWMDEETGRLEVVKEIVPQGERGERRMNDGGVDAKGRFWVVEIDWAAMARYAAMRKKKSSGDDGLSEERTGGEEPKARLWRFDPDGSLHEILSGGLAGGNGLAWSPDNKVMYVNDSPRGLVYAFDFDLESGNIANKRILVDRSSSYGDPDGMVVDTEGNLWVAGLASDRVMVFSPQGEHLRDVLLPARNPSCTAWGGKDFDILYMATGMDWAKESDDKDGGGHMYMFKPGGGLKGFAKHVFAG